MAEGLKACFTVVAAHAALAHAAEGHGAGGQMDDGVIQAAAAEVAAVQHLALHGLVLAEEVEGQRMGLGLDVGQGVVQIGVGEHRQDGSEDLLAHDGILPGHILHDGGGDAQAGLVAGAAADHLGRVDEPHQAAVVLLVDDLAVILVGHGVGAELGGDLLLNGGDQLVPDGGVTEDIVGSHAGLAAVQVLAEDDPLGRQSDLGGLLHDAGALAAQLQHGGGQVLGGAAQHFLAHRLAAGEEDHVEFLVQQRLIFGAAAGDNGHMFRREAFRHDLLEHRGGGRGVGAGLDDGGVAGGDGVDQRVQRQQHRIVPGAHDEHVAVGGGGAEAPRRELGQRRGHPALPHQAAHMADHPGGLREGLAGLAHIAFGGGLAQVGLQGAGQVLLMALQRSLELLQGRDAGLGGQGMAGGEILTLPLENGLNFHFRHGWKPPELVCTFFPADRGPTAPAPDRAGWPRGRRSAPAGGCPR